MALDTIAANGPANSGLAPEVSKSADPVGPTYDPKQIVGEVDAKYTSWRNLKRPIEVQWFLCNAMLRGVTNVQWNDALSTLERRRVPTYKERPAINKILPKFRQRKAKFLKDKRTPTVVPASSDKEDKMNATATEKALEYVARQQKLDSKYRQTLDWTLSCGKGFVWLYWDPNAVGMIKDPATGSVTETPLGDVIYESGNPFEVLVPDIGISTIGDQPEIMRVRAIPLEELKRQHVGNPVVDLIKGDIASDDLFQYQKQIATLSTKNNTNLLGGSSDKADRELNYVVRKELFTRPNSRFPKGRYVVVAGQQVLRYQEQLPYYFERHSNPYPVVEFADIEMPGQFWPTSTVEQLLGPQREYLDLRTKLVNHLANQAHPKIIASIHSKWPQNAWTDEAGEIIRILTPPGVMTPQVITPPPISQDLWKALMTIREEMDEIASLPPVLSGATGGTTSGFQVNLLQEATDSVHAPDIRAHDDAFAELYTKTRKIMAKGYDVPRLVSVVGRAHIADVVEFSQNNIDENAEIIVYTSQALANSPAVRTQQVIELWNSGILNDPNNFAESQRKALTLLDSRGIGEFQQEKKRDEEKARLENLALQKGQFVDPPLPFDDHMIHYTQHTDQMKSPEFETWPDEKQKELFAHTLVHMKFIDPNQAIQTALELGMVDLIPLLQPAQMPMGPQASVVQGAPPVEGGQGEQGPQGPQGQPPPQGEAPPAGPTPPMM